MIPRNAANRIDWRRVQAVTFDVGGTLIEPWPSVGHVYAAEAARHGVHADPGVLNETFKQSWRARGGFDYSQRAWFDVVRSTFGAAADRLPEGFFPAIYHRFEDTDVWRVYEDVRPLLERLNQAGMPMAVISNWDDRLPSLLDNLGLSAWFSTRTISFATGFTKPDARMFSMTADALGVPAEAVLHIGDSLSEDIEGAVGAGMQAMQVQRRSGRELETLPGAGPARMD